MKRRAFTLIEVLVSLAIFAIAAVVLGTAYINVLTNYNAVLGRGAQQKDIGFVRGLVLAESDRAKAEQGGQMQLEGQGTLRWRADVEPANVSDLFQLTLECEITEPGREQPRVERQTFMLLRPTWSKTGDRDKLVAAARERLAKRDFTPSP